MRVYVARYRLTSRYMIIVNRSVDSKRAFYVKLMDIDRYWVLVLCVGPVAFELVKKKG